MRKRLARLALLLSAAAPLARAQAPVTGPLILLLPASTRATALGNAWVTGRDEYAVFYNPAQVTPGAGYGVSFARYGAQHTRVALASGATVGRLTFGWGVQILDFKARPGATYPYAPAELVERGSLAALSLVAATGASFAYKGFRAGIGIKYAEDRVTESWGAVGAAPIHNGLLLADVGVSRPVLSGTAAFAVQNIRTNHTYAAPLQATLGWSRGLQAKQFDVTAGASVSDRDGWIAPGGGLEIGYGWIEGWSVAARAGARRPETSAQRPASVGATLNGDRLSMDYAVEFFDGGRHAHFITLRWR